MSTIIIEFNYDAIEAEKIVKRQGEDPRGIVVDTPVMTQTLVNWLKDSIDEYWFPGLELKSSDFRES